MDRILVVGGGLMGCAVARALVRRGRRVLVLERSVVGAEASSAAAGILAPRVEAHGEAVFRGLGLESLALWPAWAAALGDVGLRWCGAVVLGERPDEDATPMEPASRGLTGEAGWWLPEEATVDTRRLVGAVRAACGASFATGAEIQQVRADGVLAGEWLAGEVVVCAGAWTGGVVPRLAVRPVRGQLVALRGVLPADCVVFGPGGYLVPRMDEVVCGTTVEEVGFERGVTARGVAGVLAAALALCPVLAEHRFDRAWSGFRPGSPDGQPIVGRVDGVWVASGHYRNGILLAPLTAERVADAICEGRPLPAAWDPGRLPDRRG
jgi:glycine/D-amino acid oxidase-like deaminating enzyme